MLRCFRAVVDQGSLAQAAEILNRTPSAVSMMLRQFEDHVGFPLFETARKSRLTPLGRMIHFEACRALEQFEASVETIQGLARSDLGLVRLAVIPSVAAEILPPIISGFLQAHPGVQIRLSDMDSRAVGDAVTAGRADVGIGTLPETPGFERSPLFSDPFGVVCRNDHPLADDWDTLTWADVTGHRFIANGLCRLIEDEAFQPILTASRITAPNTVSLLGLVRAGVGLTLLPRLALARGGHDLAFLPLIDARARRHVHLFTPSAQHMIPAARALADQIRRTVTNLPDLHEFQNH